METMQCIMKLKKQRDLDPWENSDAYGNNPVGTVVGGFVGNPS